uniref:Putative DNA binding, helix-turn-helix domain containing protein n=1 Tax=viral metagenome TaxID=1070528 RepID=A0A6M3M0P1_9ZZZZ
MTAETADFAAVLRTERERRGLSLRQLAAASGLSVTYLWGLETRRKPAAGLTLRAFRAVSAALGCGYGSMLMLYWWQSADQREER